MYDSYAARSTFSPYSKLMPPDEKWSSGSYNFSLINRHLPTLAEPEDLLALTYCSPLHLKPTSYNSCRKSALVLIVLKALTTVKTLYCSVTVVSSISSLPRRLNFPVRTLTFLVFVTCCSPKFSGRDDNISSKPSSFSL